ncbi:MAG: leucine-rich repeat protein [Oscillospiraceae bacterium]|nr:leucine-rich repeat protein [Oscillospiraceae bacterium]
MKTNNSDIHNYGAEVNACGARSPGSIVKKAFSLIAVIVLLLTLIPLAQASTPADFVVTETGVLTAYNGSAAKVVIPEGVKIIDDDVFNTWKKNKALSKITSLTLPSTLEEIGDRAFTGLRISSVKLPEKLTRIGEGAFMYTNITQLNVPEGVTRIGNDAFRGCSALKSVVLPESLWWLGDGAFIYCSSLETLTMPKTPTKVGRWVFSQTAITSFTVPGYMTVVPEGLFDGSALANLTIPKGTTEIGARAFANCSNLEKLTLPNTLVTIGAEAFACNYLQLRPDDNGYSYLDTYNRIYKDFKNNYSLEYDSFYLYHFSNYNSHGGLMKISIPNSVTSIGIGAFAGQTNLKEVTLPKGLRRISDALFMHCDSLKTLTLPTSAYVIGSYAFYNCQALTSVKLPKSLDWISDSAFMNTGLKSITFPENLQIIGCFAFTNTALSSVKIPADVLIDIGAFSQIVNLKSITVSNKDPNYISLDGILYTKNKKRLIQYPVGKKDTSFKLPSSVTEIDDFAFALPSEYYTGKLTKVTLPAGLTKIGKSAFANQPLKSLTLPDKLKTIGEKAFEGTRLKTVKIPKSVTSMAIRTFSSENKLNITFAGNSPKFTDSSKLGDYYHRIQCSSFNSKNTFYYKKSAKGFKLDSRVFKSYILTTSISANPKSLTLNKGKKKSIAVKLSSKADPNLTWTTSNKSIATVSKSGVVTAKKKGTAKITAKTNDGSGKKVVVNVTVR